VKRYSVKVFVAACLLLIAGPAAAADIKVMISGGFFEAYEKLVPKFEAATGHKVETMRGPSMGDTPQAIPNRLARGEPADVIIMVAYALDGLIGKGQADPLSRTPLAESVIAAAVREGAPKPDISTVEAFKTALLEAKSIAYSDSASGLYISTELFSHLGILEQVKDKARKIPAEPVGRVVARGEAELGFQQLSELKPIPGITILGPIPPGAQKVTLFAAGVPVKARESQAAKELIAYLASPQAADIVSETGLKPIAGVKN
jgi:molybdate transport system substrate-binding protein